MRQDARSKYPWKEWLNGQPHEHKPDNKPELFRRYLYEYARKHEFFVNATIHGDTVKFQVFATLDEYLHGRRFMPKAGSRNSRGTFLDRSEHVAVNRSCTVCGDRLTPVVPEDETECMRFDFTTNEIVRKHA